MRFFKLCSWLQCVLILAAGIAAAWGMLAMVFFRPPEERLWWFLLYCVSSGILDVVRRRCR